MIKSTDSEGVELEDSAIYCDLEQNTLLKSLCALGCTSIKQTFKSAYTFIMNINWVDYLQMSCKAFTTEYIISKSTIWQSTI